MTVFRQDRQTLFDIAVQYCGDAQAAFEIARMNNISITDETTAALEIPAPYNRRIAEYFANNSISPATATTESNQFIVTDNNEDIITDNGKNITYE